MTNLRTQDQIALLKDLYLILQNFYESMNFCISKHKIDLSRIDLVFEKDSINNHVSRLLLHTEDNRVLVQSYSEKDSSNPS